MNESEALTAELDEHAYLRNLQRNDKHTPSYHILYPFRNAHGDLS